MIFHDQKSNNQKNPYDSHQDAIQIMNVQELTFNSQSTSMAPKIAICFKQIMSNNPNDIYKGLIELRYYTSFPINFSDIPNNSISFLISLFSTSTLPIQKSILGVSHDLITSNQEFAKPFSQASFHTIVYQFCKNPSTGLTLLDGLPVITEIIRYSPSAFLTMNSLGLFQDLIYAIENRISLNEPYECLVVYVSHPLFNPPIEYVINITNLIISAIVKSPVDCAPYISAMLSVLSFIAAGVQDYRPIEIMEKSGIVAPTASFIVPSIPEAGKSACTFLSALTYKSDRACLQLNAMGFLEQKASIALQLKCSSDFMKISSNCMVTIKGLPRVLSESVLFLNLVKSVIAEGTSEEKEMGFYNLAMMASEVPPVKLSEFLQPFPVVSLMEQLFEGSYEMGAKASIHLLFVIKKAWEKSPESNELLIQSLREEEFETAFQDYIESKTDLEEYRDLVEWTKRSFETQSHEKNVV